MRASFFVLAIAVATALVACGIGSETAAEPPSPEAGPTADAPSGGEASSAEDAAPDVADDASDAGAEAEAASDAAPDAPIEAAAPSGPGLAGGNLHTCAIAGDAGVACWGSNASGQLGDGTLDDHLAPKMVPGLSGAVQLTAGRDHTCALLADHTVWCWGLNSAGQLGDGTTIQSSSPVRVVDLPDAVEVRSHWTHTCARRVGGGMRCWGSNGGALGDGTTDDSARPVDVSGITSAIAIATGWGHSCAVLADGSAKCWGYYNVWGQIGDGTTASQQLLPALVIDFAGGAAIVAGSYHTCGRLVGGAVDCWGNDQSGALGIGTTDDGRHTSAPVPGLAGVAEVTAGGGHTCARLASGAVACWGYGPIGDGVSKSATSPTPVKGLTDAVALASGEDHACARRANGAIVCWGSDYAGQLGDGFKSDQLAPVDVVGLP